MEIEPKVLIVHDNPEQKIQIRNLFLNYPKKFFLNFCDSIPEALKILESNYVDIVVADMNFHNGDSAEFLNHEKIKNRVPVVLMVVLENEELAVQSMNLGVIDYVVKNNGSLNELPKVAMRSLREWNHIAEKKAALEAIRVSEERLRNIIANTGAGYFLIDTDGNFNDVNDAWLKMHKYRREEVIGRHFSITQIDSDLDKAGRIVESVLNGGQIYTTEFHRLCKDGTIGVHSFTVNPVYKNNKITGIEGFLIDVTEQKKNESKLLEKSDLLKLTEKISKIGGWEFDVVSGKGTWTDEVALIHDLDPNDETKTEIGLSFYHGKYREAIEKAIEEAVEYAKPYDLELEMITAKGIHKWVRTIGNPVINNGKVIQLRGIFQDITQRKYSEDKLRENARFIESIVDLSPDILYIYDLIEKNILYVNSGLVKTLSYTPEEIREMGDKYIENLMHPKDFEIYTKVIYPKYFLLESGESIHNQFRLKHKNGYWLWVESNEMIYSRNSDGSPTQIFGVIHNINKRILTEDALNSQKHNFEQMFTQSSISTQILDKDGWCERINPKLSELFGVKPESIEGKVYNIFKDEGIKQGGVLPYLDKVFKEGKTVEWEVLFDIGLAAESQNIDVVEKNKVWFYNWAYPILNQNGELENVIIQHSNITERKNAEAKIKTLSRLYATLSQVNQAIVRVKSREELFEQICQVAVKFGEYRMAWIGILNRDSGDIVPVAIEGFNEGYVEELNLNIYNIEFANAPSVIALKENKVATVFDIQTNIGLQPWQDSARKRGYHSLASIPFNFQGVPIGVLVINSDEARFITEDEIKLLEEMALDISYALDTMDLEELRIKSVELLTISEERYRSLFENMINGFAYCKMIYENDEPVDFIYLSVNDSFEKQTGLKNVSGRKVTEIIPGIRESSKDLFDMYGRVASTGEFDHFEYYVEAMDMWFDISAYSPETGYFVAVFDVITERKIAELKLRQSEERYRSLYENATIGIYRTTPDGKLLMANPAVVKMLGYDSLNELLESDIVSISYDADFSRQQFISMIIKDGKVHEVTGLETSWRHKNGSSIFIRESSHAVCDENGQVLYFEGTIEDITERKLTEIALKASEQKYKNFFDEDLTGDYIATPSGKLIACNRAYLKIFGFNTIEEAMDVNIINLYKSPEFREKMLHRLKVERKLEYVELQMRHVNSKLLHVVANIIGRFDEEGNLTEIQGYLFDDTKRRELENQLLQSQKLEGLGTLASGIAHDFNNILAIIMMNSSSWELVKHNPDSFDSNVKAIIKASERGSALVKQLLTFARKTETQFEYIDINILIEDIVKLLRETLPKSITFFTNLKGNLPDIYADLTQMNQIFINLCVNSRDAMPSGGLITISTNLVKGITIREKYSEAVESDYIVIKVKDTGEGMFKETIQRIFDPFFTTKPVGKGTGLGLSLVFGIIKFHNGFIDVESKPGKGTTFSIYLPAKKMLNKNMESKMKSIIDVKGGNETILLVEDEELIRESAEEILEYKGYKVITAVDGRDGLEKFLNKREEIDIILSDIGLPFLSGDQFYMKVREVDKNVKFIILSGFIDPQIRASMEDAGEVFFIQKPYSHVDLLEKINREFGRTD